MDGGSCNLLARQTDQKMIDLSISPLSGEFATGELPAPCVGK